MATITITCADPNDFQAVIEKAEAAVGHCNITYAKQAQALIDAGTVTSERAAAKHIAEETGEPVETVRTMIKRGKVGSGEPTPAAWPKCKNCGTADVAVVTRGRGKLRAACKDGLCLDCRRDQEKKVAAAARAKFNAIPVDQESNTFWLGVANVIGERLSGDIPFGKVPVDTIVAVNGAINDLSRYLGVLIEARERMGGT